jgi:hypothetical protein
MSLRGIIDPAISSAFLSPDSLETDPLVSYELGGVALNDASQGLEVQPWRCYINGADVVIANGLTGGTPAVQFTPGGAITSLSLAFDSNMRPSIAYVEAGVVKLRWYDTVPGMTVTTTFAGATECKCATDEKREGLDGLRDVIFAYVIGGMLYWREQRDRYLIEYTVGAVPSGKHLQRVGKNSGNRFQFEAS